MSKFFAASLIFWLAFHWANSAVADVKNLKAAKEATEKFRDSIYLVESKSRELKLAHTRFWADKVGDLSRDLIDVLDDSGDKAGDHEIRRIFRELHGSYLNLRATVKNIPNHDTRKTILRGTIENYYKMYHSVFAITPTKGHEAPYAKDDVPATEDVEIDGLPQPQIDGELDGEDKIIKKKSKVRS